MFQTFVSARWKFITCFASCDPGFSCTRCICNPAAALLANMQDVANIEEPTVLEEVFVRSQFVCSLHCAPAARLCSISKTALLMPSRNSVVIGASCSNARLRVEITDTDSLFLCWPSEFHKPHGTGRWAYTPGARLHYAAQHGRAAGLLQTHRLSPQAGIPCRFPLTLAIGLCMAYIYALVSYQPSSNSCFTSFPCPLFPQPVFAQIFRR